jgi:hypothetical protein
MAIPAGVTAATVRAAVLKYAKTEDKDFMLHPKHMVTTMPFADARAWQGRLRAIEEFQPCVKSLGSCDWLCTAAMVLMPGLSPIKVLV